MKQVTRDLGHTCVNRGIGILVVRRMWGARGKTRNIFIVRAPTARTY
jgi:hypothetical protein